MRIPTFINEPNLKVISASITICWLLLIAHLFFGSSGTSSQVIWTSIWFFLISGFLAKIKYFKILNGIFSLFLLGWCVLGITYFVDSTVESSVSSPYYLTYIIPQILILFLSIYNIYFTFINGSFSALYNDKLGVSKSQKTVFKISTMVLILVIGIYVFLDLKNLGLL